MVQNQALDFKPFIHVEGISAAEFRKQKIDISHYTCIILNSRNAVDHYFRMASELRFTVPEKTKYFWEYQQEPAIWISILIASYNTKLKYLYDCIKSIKEQIGHVGVELVWINDCSNELYSKILLTVLSEFNNLKNFKEIFQERMTFLMMMK